MYEDLFQTPDRPFRATPDVRFYFPFDSMEQTRQTALRVIRRAEGPAAIMGGIGLGKTMLAQLLAEDLQDRFDVVRLHAARLCSRRAMLQNILFELQLPYRDLSEGELRLSLMERMEPSPAHAADGLVLIVDEAQTLPTKLLEELRLITNFTRQGQARARLLLMGSLQLEETLALPEMSSFNQRLAARCFLQPMNRGQTADFVRHQFTCASVDPKQIITRDALENVYVASEGIPRLVNQVMDHALILAIANDQYPISAALIQEAWSDLQQLPMSWNQPEQQAGAPVEFGSIDDLDQDFELEPEGVDDLDNQTPATLSWPSLSDFANDNDDEFATSVGGPMSSAAPEDLEDFGPTGSSVSSYAEPETGRAPRVVFDASAMFVQRGKGAENMTGQATSRPSTNSTTKSTPMTYGDSSTDPMGHRTGDQDLFVFQEDDQSSEKTTMGRNMFAAWNPVPDSISYELDLATSDSLKHDDNDMQAYFDAMEPMAIPMPLARATEPSAIDPFGQDFDEEFTVDASDVQRWQERQRQRQQAAKANDVTASDMDASKQAAWHAGSNAGSTAPSPAAKQQPMPPTMQPAVVAQSYDMHAIEVSPMPVESLVVQPDYSGTIGSDFVAMTATGAVDDQLQQEIEDLISQLNFSAFSVEMDSVEQISPEYLRKAASGLEVMEMAEDAYPSTLPMHRRNAMQADESEARGMPSMDDDRDLLIIEEEVPASMRHQSPKPAAPTVGTLSYPELFQQLRG